MVYSKTVSLLSLAASMLVLSPVSNSSEHLPQPPESPEELKERLDKYYSPPEAEDELTVAVKRYSETKRLADQDNNLSLGVRLILRRIDEIGLSESDSQLVKNVNSKKESMFPLFESYAKRFETELSQPAPDASSIGQLLNEVRCKEQADKSALYQAAIDEMSLDGRATLMAAVADALSQKRVQEVDFYTLSFERPDYVLQIAKRFAERMAQRLEVVGKKTRVNVPVQRSAPPGARSNSTSSGSWIIESGGE